MTIHIGNSEIADIKIGNTQINSVWIGGTKLWDRTVDEQSLTVGARYENFVGTHRGYSSGVGTWVGAMGVISDGTFNGASGAIIDGLLESAYGSYDFIIRGTHSNSGWSKMTINGVTFNRADASFSQSAGKTSWSWTYTGSTPFTNGTHNVVWTS